MSRSVAVTVLTKSSGTDPRSLGRQNSAKPSTEESLPHSSQETSQLEEQQILAAKREHRENIARIPAAERAVPVTEYIYERFGIGGFGHDASEYRVRDPLFDPEPALNQGRSETLPFLERVEEGDEKYDLFETYNWPKMDREPGPVVVDDRILVGIGRYASGQQAGTEAWSYENELDLDSITQSNEMNEETDPSTADTIYSDVRPTPNRRIGSERRERYL